jgi:hypothetical protein
MSETRHDWRQGLGPLPGHPPETWECSGCHGQWTETDGRVPDYCPACGGEEVYCEAPVSATQPMDEGTLEQALWELLGELATDTAPRLPEAAFLTGAEVRKVEQPAGLAFRLYSPGVVVRLADGTRFRLAITREPEP